MRGGEPRGLEGWRVRGRGELRGVRLEPDRGHILQLAVETDPHHIPNVPGRGPHEETEPLPFESVDRPYHRHEFPRDDGQDPNVVQPREDQTLLERELRIVQRVDGRGEDIGRGSRQVSVETDVGRAVQREDPMRVVQTFVHTRHRQTHPAAQSSERDPPRRPLAPRVHVPHPERTVAHVAGATRHPAVEDDGEARG